MITAVLIDDDTNLRNGMRKLLSFYAPDISIIGEAEDVATGVKVIDMLKPQVLFLDIQLNDGTGFDILEKLAAKNSSTTSHIVFITAHEEYAIKAFRFSALDFLLKPVDIDELEIVIGKIRATVDKKDSYAHIDLLLENIRKKVDNYKRIALTTADGIHLYEVSDIIRCEGEDNYTTFYIRNNKPVTVSKTLKEYEEMLEEYGFERIHQKHLINITFLKSYVKKDGGFVVMADQAQLPVSVRKKERLQDLIKSF